MSFLARRLTDSLLKPLSVTSLGKKPWARLELVFPEPEPRQDEGSGQSEPVAPITVSPSVSPFLQFVEELEDKVFLNCTGNITWQEGTMGSQLPDNQTLDLGKRVLDPRAVYQCRGAQENGVSHTLQVYYRSACLLSLWVGMEGASGREPS